MDLQLQRKRALVTGSSGGIGEAIAKALAREGVAVAIHGRRSRDVGRVVSDIQRNGGTAVAATGDLATDEGGQSVVDKVVEAFGDVDILVNNAGIYPLRGWDEATAQDWMQLYALNVLSIVRLVPKLIIGMKERRWGRIIQMSSSAAANPSAGVPAYSASKAATAALTVSLCKELASSGITVNTVSPGPIVTPGWREFALQIAAKQGWGNDLVVIEQKLLEGFLGNPTGRIGQPEEVGDLVCFLASPRAGFINGANLRIDGGLVPTTN